MGLIWRGRVVHGTAGCLDALLDVFAQRDSTKVLRISDVILLVPEAEATIEAAKR